MTTPARRLAIVLAWESPDLIDGRPRRRACFWLRRGSERDLALARAHAAAMSPPAEVLVFATPGLAEWWMGAREKEEAQDGPVSARARAEGGAP